MIVAYLIEDGVLKGENIGKANEMLLRKAIWIDLLQPTQEEGGWVEAALDIQLPAREAMRGIEISSRLHKQDNALSMTAAMLAHSESASPILDAVSFVLTRQTLITLRYVELQAFSLFISDAQRHSIADLNVDNLLVNLLDAAIDRVADILERIGDAIEKSSQIVFRHQGAIHRGIDFRKILQEIGSRGDLCSKMRESLTTFKRLISYFSQNEEANLGKWGIERLAALSDDMQALSDHVSFLSSQINFLLNATLGMINIQQSNIIKIFSVAAVIFLPPTLVAGVYGMNLTFMPSFLYAHYGFPIALATMFFSAIIPYQFFKWKKWM